MPQMTYQQVLSYVLQALKRVPDGQYEELVEAVLRAAIGASVLESERPNYRHEAELVRQAYWECVVKGILVPGRDKHNAQWPWYRLTDYGSKIVESPAPQPYDRDGFLHSFRQTVPTADPVVEGYLVEAVVSFNAGCLRAASVMLGVASEQLVLVLCDAFKNALIDGGKKSAFEKDMKAWQILTKYTALKSRLDAMVSAKKLVGEHAETVATSLGGVFELLRQYRNAAGHPNVPGDIISDLVFIHLRVFIEHARRTTALTEYFVNNAADW